MADGQNSGRQQQNARLREALQNAEHDCDTARAELEVERGGRKAAEAELRRALEDARADAAAVREQLGAATRDQR
ncbi:hypothetical protein GCM10009527_054470 [Actinomadura nitritigenes]|uniref:Uncharacterized protein n=1 Tax=Actinomadura nitritigenes TaxID=134602 RepID=A0ABS3R8Z6_9ACTN|nr:hypothetical protein [Actinomadura nitritigenes]MBO2442694.1 hypothetical protein [Actinomadura nitritigenes]